MLEVVDALHQGTTERFLVPVLDCPVTFSPVPTSRSIFHTRLLAAEESSNLHELPSQILLTEAPQIISKKMGSPILPRDSNKIHIRNTRRLRSSTTSPEIRGRGAHVCQLAGRQRSMEREDEGQLEAAAGDSPSQDTAAPLHWGSKATNLELKVTGK